MICTEHIVVRISIDELFLTDPTNLSAVNSFWRISNDGNLLPRPVQVNSVRLGVAERELFEDEVKDTLLNPIILVEVLSESTEAYDRGTKLEHYRAIDSLGEYLLVTQDRPRVEQYTFQGGPDRFYKDIQPPTLEVGISSVNCTIALADVYYNVD